MHETNGAALRAARAWGALGLIALLTACDDDGGLVSVQPEIEVSPEAGSLLRYDEVVLGVSGPAEPGIITVRNVGDGLLNLTSATVIGEGADQFRVSSYPEVIPAGATGELFVRFEPTLTGTTTAELVLRTNDLDEAEIRWNLRGPARDPCRLEVSPPHQVFILGETKTVELRSASSYECVITALSTDSSLFTLTDAPPLPFAVPPGATRTLSVQHSGSTIRPGRPIRELRVREAEGTEEVVSFEGEEPLYGCLDIGPDRLSFDTLPMGMVGEREVRVRNRCAEPAIITNAAVSIAYEQFTVLGSFPMTVPPREEVRLTVQYRPFQTLGDQGNLNILTNDAALPLKRIVLFGNAAEAVVDIFPRRIDFGAVAYRNPQGASMRSECASAGRLVQVFSSGDSPAVISRIGFDPMGDELFQIASVTVDGRPVDYTQPVTMGLGSEMRISLVFYPTRDNPAPHAGTLVVEHNGSGERTEIDLRGQGASDGPAEDVFTQLPGPKTDILWVIDNSCSMFDEQARLQSNLSQFVGYADGLDSDYQMAVVTTDHESPRAGTFERCFPHPAIVSSDYANTPTRDAAFRCMFDVGVNGPGNEGGLGAAKRALERALDPDLPNNPNLGFLRDDANLAMVWVSDEPDGTELSQDVLYNFFISVKDRRNPERVKGYAIVQLNTTNEGCDDGWGRPGPEYSAMANRLGGAAFNICADDWQPILQSLGLDVFTPIDEWALTRQADPATLDVTVDGVSVRRDGTNGWTYDISGNSVKFHGAALPDPGAEIRVRYLGLCRP